MMRSMFRGVHVRAACVEVEEPPQEQPWRCRADRELEHPEPLELVEDDAPARPRSHPIQRSPPSPMSPDSILRWCSSPAQAARSAESSPIASRGRYSSRTGRTGPRWPRRAWRGPRRGPDHGSRCPRAPRMPIRPRRSQHGDWQSGGSTSSCISSAAGPAVPPWSTWNTTRSAACWIGACGRRWTP